MVDSNATLTRDEVLALATTDVRTKIGDKYLVPILSHSPFIRDGCFVNMRDVGAVPGSALPTGRIYRSGTLETVDPEAVAWLSGHVKKIFDLRGGSERAKSPDPEIPGVENVWFETEGQYPTPDVAQFAVDGGKPAWGMQMLSVAMSYKPTIRALLEHVRDNPEEPFMFHCMAGRDRTGVVAGLLQALAGTSLDDIIYDYLLSRLGTEVARDKLLQGAMLSVGVRDLEEPGFLNLVDLRPEYFQAFVDALRLRFGSWDGYVIEGLEMTKEDLDTIKANLRS